MQSEAQEKQRSCFYPRFARALPHSRQAAPTGCYHAALIENESPVRLSTDESAESRWIGGLFIAINKAWQAALRALSYTDINIKRNYRLKRQLEAAAGRPANPFYRPWDHRVDCGDHTVPVRLFAPQGGRRPPPVLLFFHGGGWVTGNIDSYDRVCANMAQLTGSLVVSVDYRLAPEFPFPAGLEDCYAIARELYLDAALLGVKAREITMIGDSAGANLAAAVSLLARDRGQFLPTRQILIYPALYNDHSDASPFPSVRENGSSYLLTSKRISDYMELYRSSEEDLKSCYFAPLLAENLSGQPPTLIITAAYDPLRDEGEAYAAALAQAGNEVVCQRVEDALHGYFSLPPRFSLVRQTYGIINRFLKQQGVRE